MTCVKLYLTWRLTVTRLQSSWEIFNAVWLNVELISGMWLEATRFQEEISRSEETDPFYFHNVVRHSSLSVEIKQPFSGRTRSASLIPRGTDAAGRSDTEGTRGP